MHSLTGMTDADAEIDRLILDEQAVAAVELIRQRMGCDLATAMEIFEQRKAALRGWPPPLAPVPPPVPADLRGDLTAGDEVQVGKADDRYLKAYADAGGYVLLYHDGWLDRLRRLDVTGIEEALVVFGEFADDHPAFLERPWQPYTDEV
jgi:hypothetical protein